MQAGFARRDITPRVGVELCGFGPFRCRHSVAVRDRLWARAMALAENGRRAVVVSCDLIGTAQSVTERVRRLVADTAGLPGDAVMVHSTHTHSGPATGPYIGWGAPDEPYLEILPQRIAAACLDALSNLRRAAFAHAEVPCEGIALNREYDVDAPPLTDVLRDDWRPAKPELTDTTCHVLRVEHEGRLAGFLSYYGCHPVVCCAATRAIHGDYCGVATNMLEAEHPGAVGLFLQGAQGDINTCAVHKPEEESLRALDVVAGRYARAVREGLTRARPLTVQGLRHRSHARVFTRKPWTLDQMRAMQAEQEAIVHAPQATEDESPAGREARMATVFLIALRRLIARAEAGESLAPPIELQGIRFGPVALLGSPFETFRAIKNEVVAAARSPIALVMGLVNDSVGYAPDRTAAARGGYAADMVPLICGSLPFANVHDELVRGLLELEADLGPVHS